MMAESGRRVSPQVCTGNEGTLISENLALARLQHFRTAFGSIMDNARENSGGPAESHAGCSSGEVSRGAQGRALWHGASSQRTKSGRTSRKKAEPGSLKPNSPLCTFSIEGAPGKRRFVAAPTRRWPFQNVIKFSFDGSGDKKIVSRSK